MLPARPTTTEDLARLIAEAARDKTQVRIQGSASMPLSRFDPARPIRDISTLRMNKILDHAITDMTVTVQAGISLEALQRELAWHNQWLPVDPPALCIDGRSPMRRTLAGLIATNSLGPLRAMDAGANDWRRLLLGMRWINAEGTVIKGGGRTMKNVAGYHTPRLMIGAAGTLGAIAELTLRTSPRPEEESAVTYFCPSAAAANALFAAIRLAPVTPAYLQLCPRHTFASNPLQLPAPPRDGLALTAGFLDRPASCAAQIDAIRQLPEAAAGESISHPAAPAGRLRLWMTSEPPPVHPQMPFRAHMLPTQVCDFLQKLDRVKGTWLIAEAATAVIRGHAPLADLQRLLPPTAALLILDPRYPTPPPSLYAPIKQALDPAAIFGTL
jgi:glycolate oxidase FAD binding subunit